MQVLAIRSFSRFRRPNRATTLATGVFTITLTSAELTIDKDLTIDGAGAKVVISGAKKFSVFNITAGAVAISKLTIANGQSGGATSGGAGGINHTGGTLTLNDCLLTRNGNDSGAIFNGTGASAVVNNCTSTRNTAAYGAGIRNVGMLTLSNSTVTDNSDFGFKAVSNEGTARVRNTIIAGNNSASSESDVGGNFISEGHNFIGMPGSSTGFGSSGSHDQVGSNAIPADPKLGPLQDNGGPTATLRPLAGSPVIDQGNRGTDSNSQPINTDQPGAPPAKMLPVGIGGCVPRIFARFAYTFCTKPKARSCRVHVARGRLNRSQA